MNIIHSQRSRHALLVLLVLATAPALAEMTYVPPTPAPSPSYEIARPGPTPIPMTDDRNNVAVPEPTPEGTEPVQAGNPPQADLVSQIECGCVLSIGTRRLRALDFAAARGVTREACASVGPALAASASALSSFCETECKNRFDNFIRVGESPQSTSCIER